MTIEARLRRIEPKAKRRSVKRLLSDVSLRLDGAGLDCLQVFGIHVARDILATCPGDRTTLARATGARVKQFALC